MFTDALALFAWHQVANEMGGRRNETKIPEPEFKPFRFPEKDPVTARAQEIASANVTREPKTLEELGVPRALAFDMEATFRAIGAIRGDRVTGYVFRTPDGASYELRVSSTNEQIQTNLAA